MTMLSCGGIQMSARIRFSQHEGALTALLFCISQLYSINDQPCVKISDELTKVRASGTTTACMVLSSDRRTPLALLGAVLLEPETLLDELDCLGITGRACPKSVYSCVALSNRTPVIPRQSSSSSNVSGSRYLGQLIRDLDARLVVDRVELRDARLPASVVTSRFRILMRRPFEQNTGDPEAVKLVKQRFGLEEHGAEESKWGPTV
jgi:hypothetical protein